MNMFQEMYYIFSNEELISGLFMRMWYPELIYIAVNILGCYF
jgi:hypothetical protein